eukprot:1631587-Pleurochrysis_carterae.AAC.7
METGTALGAVDRGTALRAIARKPRQGHEKTDRSRSRERGGEAPRVLTVLGAVEKGIALGAMEERSHGKRSRWRSLSAVWRRTVLGAMEERNGREASKRQPLGAVQKEAAFRSQCISQGASASNLTSLYRRGDVQSLTIGPLALLARSESGSAPWNSGATFQARPPPGSDLRGRLNTYRSLSSATPTLDTAEVGSNCSIASIKTEQLNPSPFGYPLERAAF